MHYIQTKHDLEVEVSSMEESPSGGCSIPTVNYSRGKELNSVTYSSSLEWPHEDARILCGYFITSGHNNALRLSVVGVIR